MILLSESGLILMAGLQEDHEVFILCSMVIRHYQMYLDYTLEHHLSVANTLQSLQRLNPVCLKSLAGSTFNFDY